MSNLELAGSVKKVLDANGFLPKIKAQLRAAVFTAIFDMENHQKPTTSEFLNDEDAMVAISLIVDFLQTHQLQNAENVLIPESQLTNEDIIDRSALSKKIGVSVEGKESLLVSLIKRGGGGGGSSVNNSKNSDSNVTRKDAKNNSSGELSRVHSGGEAFAINADDESDEEYLSNTMKRVPTAIPQASKPFTQTQEDAPTPEPAKKKDSIASTIRNIAQSSRDENEQEDEEEEEDDEDKSDSDDSIAGEIKKINHVHQMLSQNKYGKLSQQGQQQQQQQKQPQQQQQQQSSVLSDEEVYDEEIDEDIEYSQNFNDDDEEDEEEEEFVMAKSAGNKKNLVDSVSLSNLSVSDRSVDGSMALDEFDHIEEVQRK